MVVSLWLYYYMCVKGGRNLGTGRWFSGTASLAEVFIYIYIQDDPNRRACQKPMLALEMKKKT